MHAPTVSTLNFGEPQIVDGSLSERARGLVGSEILKIAASIREMKAAGRKICDLTVGDFDSRYFPIPRPLLEGVREALVQGETNYPPADGVKALREAVTEFTARMWGARYPIESVMIASGARPLLYAAYRCVLDPGSKVVYPVPSWNNNHYEWMSAATGVAIETRAEDAFMPTVAQVAPHLSDARMLVLNSPLNPTGTVVREEPLRELLGAVVEENDRRRRSGTPGLFLLHDQVYSSLVFGTARHWMPVSLIPESAPWVISVDGISKSLAATGLRVGWALAAPPLVARMKAMIGHIGAWAPRPEQVALAGFLRDAPAVDSFREAMNDRVRQRLDALYTGFSKMKADGYPVDCISPQGAIYLSLRLNLVGRTIGDRRLDSNEAIRRLLLDDAGLAVVPFQAFGLARETGWFRLSVGAVSLEEIEQALPRLRRLLDGLD